MALPDPTKVPVAVWSARSGPLWPSTANHVQVIITGGLPQDEHLIWIVIDGSTLHAVYRSAAGSGEAPAQLAAALIEAANGGGTLAASASSGGAGTGSASAPRAAVAVLFSAFGDGGQGDPIGPPPHIGGPRGVPEALLRAVINTAVQVNATFQAPAARATP